MLSFVDTVTVEHRHRSAIVAVEFSDDLESKRRRFRVVPCSTSAPRLPVRARELNSPIAVLTVAVCRERARGERVEPGSGALPCCWLAIVAKGPSSQWPWCCWPGYP